ncbi:MAG: toprim domain-containing protein, partial [Acidobacteriaceae bacterium]
IASIERTKQFNGAYHVLHGTLSPLNGIGPEQLRIESLLQRVRNHAPQEVILATNPTVEGEATAGYLIQQLRGLPVRITRIATGIPAGADIEYADEVTMSRAMEGRREV